MKNVVWIALVIIVGGIIWWFTAEPAFEPQTPPEENDGQIVEEIPETPADVSYKDMIRVEEPLPESTITSPLVIRGEARGNWYFEATFPIVLTNWDGLIIAEGYAEAQDEWMTTDYVPFEATLVFAADTAVSDRGTLILHKANASGLPEHDDAFEYTVYFEE